MDKELIQAVIDNLTIANPRRDEFEKDLRALIKEHENPKPIRLSCEAKFETEE